MRLRNPFKPKPLREIPTVPITPEKPPAPAPTAEEIVAARKARAEANKKTPEPVMPSEAKPTDAPPSGPTDAYQQALALRMQLIQNSEVLVESLGTKIVAAIKSEPYPISVVTFVLDMLRTTAIEQARNAPKR